MGQSINSKLTCDEVEYGIMDMIIPAFSLRHIPRILKEPDKLVRGYELGINAIYNIAQAVIYVPIVYSLTENLFK